MADRILAELAALADGEDAFAEILNAVRGVLMDLDRNLSAGLAAWDGDARHAYDHAHGIWRTATDDMADQLAGLKRAIGVAHGNYGRSLSANVRMWHGA